VAGLEEVKEGPLPGWGGQPDRGHYYFTTIGEKIPISLVSNSLKVQRTSASPFSAILWAKSALHLARQSQNENCCSLVIFLSLRDRAEAEARSGRSASRSSLRPKVLFSGSPVYTLPDVAFEGVPKPGWRPSRLSPHPSRWAGVNHSPGWQPSHGIRFLLARHARYSNAHAP
jgi:hypothetical protein